MARFPTNGLRAAGLLALAACGGPVPGEAVDSAMAPEPMPEIVSPDRAIHTAAIPSIDPEAMQAAEIERVLPAGPRCGFSYTATSMPVLSGAVSPRGGSAGVVKIHGRLVELRSEASSLESLTGPTEFSADGIRMDVRPLGETVRIRNGEPWEAEMHFRIEEGLTVGYRGWYGCEGLET